MKSVGNWEGRPIEGVLATRLATPDPGLLRFIVNLSCHYAHGSKLFPLEPKVG